MWGIDDVASAGVAAAALLLFSPLMALICAVGAAVGTIMGEQSCIYIILKFGS